jgi:hypothetical protein
MSWAFVYRGWVGEVPRPPGVGRTRYRPRTPESATPRDGRCGWCQRWCLVGRCTVGSQMHRSAPTDAAGLADVCGGAPHDATTGSPPPRGVGAATPATTHSCTEASIAHLAQLPRRARAAYASWTVAHTVRAKSQTQIPFCGPQSSPHKIKGKRCCRTERQREHQNSWRRSIKPSPVAHSEFVAPRGRRAAALRVSTR